jgi:predicted nucleotidyltransferase
MIHRPDLPPFDASELADVAERLGIRLVVAFGSRIGGALPPGDDSDFDLAVLRDRGRGAPATHAECYSGLAGIFSDLSVDLAFLDDADPLFRHEVMAGAVLLHGDPDLFADFRSFAYRDFVDSKDLRELEHEALSQEDGGSPEELS